MAFVALAASLGGCPGPTFVVQQYAGPVRPRETIATLRVLNASAPQERAPVAFQAEANKVYRITYVLGAPRIYEVDRSADTTGADVTQP